MNGTDATQNPVAGPRNAHGSTRRRGRQLLVGAVLAVLSLASLACAPSVPQGVLQVPGQFVGTTQYPSGEYGPATVIMCLDSRSAVHIETGEGGDSSIGIIDLEWQGTRYYVNEGGGPVTLTTPVLEPGCGTLSFFFTGGHVVKHLAVKVTKV